MAGPAGLTLADVNRENNQEQLGANDQKKKRVFASMTKMSDRKPTNDGWEHKSEKKKKKYEIPQEAKKF